MKDVISALEELEKNVKSASDAPKTDNAIKMTRKTVQNTMTHLSGHEKILLEQLDSELSVWEKKLNIILKESAGREGIAKHSKHWVERLKAVSS